MTDDPKPTASAKATRLAGFANFFKGYMSISTIVAASIPIPVASWKLIPIYAQQRGFLTVYASLFCFLLLAFVFSIRHRLAAPMFTRGKMGAVIAALPFVFILLTLASIVTYHVLIQQSIEELRELGYSKIPMNTLLDQMDGTQIPYAIELAACYLGIFIFAESAFVLMAIREYLQDLLHLDEAALLRTTPKTLEVRTQVSVPQASEQKDVVESRPRQTV
jgi:hypothetical protein